jgi:hypothetical protein
MPIRDSNDSRKRNAHKIRLRRARRWTLEFRGLAAIVSDRWHLKFEEFQACHGETQWQGKDLTMHHSDVARIRNAWYRLIDQLVRCDGIVTDWLTACPGADTCPVLMDIPF